ncbi:hypothetical protein P280DRAFT_469514 [Massarina eburnea CBS 473.64]|uniref:Nuclear protein DGCR14 n=1 Tax=Massarina eburnea CBS 473.64 TaxID=1395130 RepID=A0A6A6S341_9PLEO|nr:hypothetical protein P280DRAFT_469514 [Massarina eburnea CBS 473.64]
MSSSNSKALTKRPASTALMPPPSAPKRIKRPTTVLDEDTYTSAISHIIRRDFFPGLAETDAQSDYLNALESKNNAWIREAGNKLTEVMTPVAGRRAGGAARNTRFKSESGFGGGVAGGQTPSTWGADTPRTVAGEQEEEEEEEEEEHGLGKLDKGDLDMSLGAFQAKYTSEDQESFDQILDTQNHGRFEKNAWLRDGNRYASKQRVAQQKVIEARETTSASNEIVLRPSQNLDDRPAAPNTHKHTAFNNLMFAPDGIESWASTRAQAAQAASLAPPKRVLHANTRLPVFDNEPARPPSPTQSAIRDAIAGRPRLSESEGGYAGSETPRVNGYAFVDAQPPSPESSSGGSEAPTDLLERFGATGSTGATFTISDSQRREKLHHKMVDKISASKRPSSGPASNGFGKNLGLFTSETPRFLSAPTPAARLQGGMTPGAKKIGNLTPAAQKLFQSMGGATPKANVGGFGEKSGKAREWTPVPGVKRRM